MKVHLIFEGQDENVQFEQGYSVLTQCFLWIIIVRALSPGVLCPGWAGPLAHCQSMTVSWASMTPAMCHNYVTQWGQDPHMVIHVLYQLHWNVIQTLIIKTG